MSKIRNLMKIVVFSLIFAFIFQNVQKISLPYFDNSQGAATGFFCEEENSIDVLFLGSSNMFHTIKPLVMYEESGIRAFDFGSSSQSLNMSYMYLVEALKTQSPKVVCLEVLCAKSNLNGELYEQGRRWGFTYFPTSWNKLVRLYDQQNEMIDAEYLSYLFPLLRYKSRLLEVEKADFLSEVEWTYTKGCGVSSKVKQVAYGEVYWEKTDWQIDESNIVSLNQIKDLCEENGIELVLFKSPTPTLWKNEYSEAIAKYAEENELPFIDYNLLIDELGIDVNTCFYDAGHLNHNGSILTTRYMTEYLKSNYVLEDYRGGEVNSWDIACDEWYKRQANISLANSADLRIYLEKLVCEDYTIGFLINGDIDTEVEEQVLNFFDIDVATQAKGALFNSGTLVALVGGDEYSWHGTQKEQDYAFEREASEEGSVSNATLYVNGVNCNAVSHGISIIVYDNNLEEFVSIAGFDADNGYTRVSLDVNEVTRR